MTEERSVWRFRIFIGLTGVFLLFILIRYGTLMLSPGNNEGRNYNNSQKVERGPILDRNGNILAIQNKLSTVSAWTPHVSEPEKCAYQLSSILGIEEQEILETLRSSQGYTFIKRKISPSEENLIQELKDSGELNGISLETEYGRNYPEKEMASHLLGYVNIDNLGCSGLEYTFNDVLSPEISTNTSGTVYGNQVFLTIDIETQYKTEQIAHDLFTEYSADSVMLLVMDAKNGDFLSYASFPSFDPNRFNSYTPAEMKNRPISFMYEPGSVFKVFSLASFLQLDGITPSTEFFCSGYYEHDLNNGTKFRINCLGNHGTVDAEHILKYSCNSGASYASETVSEADFYKMLKKFGFGEITSIPLNGEERGQLRLPEAWSPRSKPTIAMGQEISVTAIQVITAATTLCNDGYLLEPHIVKKIVSPDGKVLNSFSRNPLRQVLDSKKANQILSMMTSVTQPDGTASRAAIDGITVAAKTGTAQKIDPELRAYSEEAFVASSLAIFPAEDPEVIVYVVIDHPRGPKYFGGQIAAPAIRDLGEYLVENMPIIRNNEEILSSDTSISIARQKLPEIKDTIPDFTGLSKRVVTGLFKRDDIIIQIEGNGWVVKQDPEPGTAFEPGMTITLELQ